MNAYPKTLYAVTGGSVSVDCLADENALGPGWFDNPQVLPSDDSEGAAAAADNTAATTPKRKKKAL